MNNKSPAWVVSRYHDDGTATFEQNEGIVFKEEDAFLLLQKQWPGADIRRAPCEHFAWIMFVDGKENDVVWLTERLPIITDSHKEPKIGGAQWFFIATMLVLSSACLFFAFQTGMVVVGFCAGLLFGMTAIAIENVLYFKPKNGSDLGEI